MYDDDNFALTNNNFRVSLAPELKDDYCFDYVNDDDLWSMVGT
jgi:hypothetical protein